MAVASLESGAKSDGSICVSGGWLANARSFMRTARFAQGTKGTKKIFFLPLVKMWQAKGFRPDGAVSLAFPAP
jgi:hypothetical protein